MTQSLSQVPPPLSKAHPSFRRVTSLGPTWHIRLGKIPATQPTPTFPSAPQSAAHLSEQPSSGYRPRLLARMPFPSAPAALLLPELHGKCSSSRVFLEASEPCENTPRTPNTFPGSSCHEEGASSSPETSRPQSWVSVFVRSFTGHKFTEHWQNAVGWRYIREQDKDPFAFTELTFW